MWLQDGVVTAVSGGRGGCVDVTFAFHSGKSCFKRIRIEQIDDYLKPLPAARPRPSPELPRPSLEGVIWDRCSRCTNASWVERGDRELTTLYEHAKFVIEQTTGDG